MVQFTLFTRAVSAVFVFVAVFSPLSAIAQEPAPADSNTSITLDTEVDDGGAVVIEPGNPAPAGPLGEILSLEAFIDGVVNTVMHQRQIPGAVVTIVQHDQVLMNKGYGVANIETRAPIDPVTTLFRIASISKTINATAVMQLVEQGKLDLNAEANMLLDQYNAPLRIPEHYSERIRLVDLINHTAGFDERAIGMSTLDLKNIASLGDYLTRRMPPQVMPPRETISYSNHGVALSGLLVQLASNTSYNLYIKDNIYTPLGMTHSSFEWNESIAPNLAQGYEVSGGRVTPVPFDYANIGPAGSMLSTGADMANYMIAHLQKGRFGESRILQEATIDEMHKLQFKQDERLNAGMAVAFFTGTRNGHRYLEHGGDLNGFASDLWLLPDDNVGLFVSCTVDDGALRAALIRQFMDRYFPEPKPAPRPPDPTATVVMDPELPGSYRLNRYARLSIEKLATLMEQSSIYYDANGTLWFQRGGEAGQFVETEPGIFTSVREGNRAVFRKGADGKVTHFLTLGGAFEKLPWYEEARWQFTFIVAVIVILASAVLGWPVVALFRRKRDGGPTPAPSHYRTIVWIFAALSLFLMITFGYNMLNLDRWEFSYGMPQRIILLLCIPPILALGAVIVAFETLGAWWHGYWSGLTRLHFTLVSAACIALIPFFVYWNLLGFNW